MIFASLSGEGSLIVDVCDSGIGFRLGETVSVVTVAYDRVIGLKRLRAGCASLVAERRDAIVAVVCLVFVERDKSVEEKTMRYISGVDEGITSMMSFTTEIDQ